METTNPLDVAAAAAHGYWCRKMLADGWRRGAKVDREAKTHDALKPYDELSEFDKQMLYQSLEIEEMHDRLTQVGSDALMDRELCADDIYEGMEVRREGKGEIGRITMWTLADETSGRLESIFVMWPDGNEVECFAGERILVPVVQK